MITILLDKRVNDLKYLIDWDGIIKTKIIINKYIIDFGFLIIEFFSIEILSNYNY